MLKKLLLVFLCFFLFIGCTKKINQNDNIKRIYLSSKYYNNSGFIDVKSDDINNINSETYLLFTYNNYCTLPIPCEDIFKEFMNIYNINILSIPIDEFKKTEYYETVKYAPSVILINNNQIITYLDANSDSDLKKYQDATEFSKWLDKYIYFQNNK